MKRLKTLLEREGIDTSKLRVLFEQEGSAVAALTVDGDSALGLWERLYALVPKMRCWPVLLNPEEDDGQLPDTQDARPVADILKEAESIDGRALLEQWHDQNLKNLREDADRHSAKGYEEDGEHFRKLLRGPKEFRGIPRGDWPAGAFPTSPFAVGRTITHGHNNVSRSVTAALVPTANGWEVAAWLKFGGWNANPRPADHVAIHRYWYEQHVAKLVAMKSDTVEMMVEKPPRTREAAMLLARDQYHYCEDIVEQGTYSLEALAAGLLGGEAWFFWWD